MKQLTFDKNSEGKKVIVSEIEDSMKKEAELYREKLLDDLSMFSDDLTELLLSNEDISEEMLRGVLREATISDMAVPVLCGSALDGIGVQPVMDAACYYLPSPSDIPPVEGQDPTRPDDPELSRRADPQEPFCGLLFKIEADKHGDLNYVRVYSGTLNANSRVLNPREDKKENIPQLWRIQADRREQIQSASAGDICGIIGLRFSVTGDTLCDVKYPILLEPITFPETVVSMAIEPESADEHKKLKTVLEMMKRQDPTFRAIVNEETGQTLICGMGELHLEIIKHRLLREHKVRVRVHNPRVSYRESIQNSAEVHGICQKTLNGTRHYAEIKLLMEPLSEDSQAVEIVYDCNDEAFKPEYKNIVLESLREESQGGGQLGFPLIGVRMTVKGGTFNDTETTEPALRMAVSDAYRKALKTGNIVLLEPIMRLEISTPDEYVGDLVSDLHQRRGIVTQTHNRGNLTVIESETPLSNLFGYSSAMLSLTKGRASSSMEPLKYRSAPPEVLKNFML